MENFYAHGKLMLTGEYVVLDGANALAIPAKFGQKLEIKSLETNTHQIEWNSYNADGSIWFQTYFPKQPENDIEEKLLIILKTVEQLNAEIFYHKNYIFNTYLQFPNNWGLGSSSTLISLLAQWAKVNPYVLLEKTFGGSGYDIACATANTPIIYNFNKKEKVKNVALNTNWTKNTYFIFLNKKQNSREAIAYYKTLNQEDKKIEIFNAFTNELVNCNNTENAMLIIQEHEKLMRNLLQMPSINEQFNNFEGVCKSLGAWGGDFIMAISKEEQNYVKNYFANKGYNTIFNFEEMIWKEN